VRRGRDRLCVEVPDLPLAALREHGSERTDLARVALSREDPKEPGVGALVDDLVVDREPLLRRVADGLVPEVRPIARYVLRHRLGDVQPAELHLVDDPAFHDQLDAIADDDRRLVQLRPPWREPSAHPAGECTVLTAVRCTGDRARIASPLWASNERTVRSKRSGDVAHVAFLLEAPKDHLSFGDVDRRLDRGSRGGDRRHRRRGRPARRRCPCDRETSPKYYAP